MQKSVQKWRVSMKNKKSTKRIKNIFTFTVMICSLCLFCGFLVTEKASAKKTTVKKVSSALKNGTFTVSGKGKMPESAMPKVAQKKKIKKIVIKNGVTELPEDAFRDCSKATVITIAPTVNRIGAMAFYNTGVEKITISDEVKYIRENAFNSLLSSTSQKFSIRSVVLNNNIETLPKYAFAGNKEIKVYKNKEIMIQRYTFDNCGEYEIIRLTH